MGSSVGNTESEAGQRQRNNPVGTEPNLILSEFILIGDYVSPIQSALDVSQVAPSHVDLPLGDRVAMDFSAHANRSEDSNIAWERTCRFSM